MSDAPLHLIALALFAEINARIDGGESRPLVLGEKGLSEDEFRREQQRWLQLLAAQAEQQQWQLQQRYSAVYSKWRLRANEHEPPPAANQASPGRSPTTGSPLQATSAVSSGTSPGFPGAVRGDVAPILAPAPAYTPPVQPAPFPVPASPSPSFPSQPQAAAPGVTGYGAPAPIASSPIVSPAFVSSPVVSPAHASPKPEPAPFPMPAAPAFVSPGFAAPAGGAEPAPFPMPTGPTQRAEPAPFPMPAPQASFGQAAPSPYQPPREREPLFVSPRTEPAPLPAAEQHRPAVTGGPPYFSSSQGYRTEPAQQTHHSTSAGGGTAASPAFAASGYFVTNATGAWQAQAPEAAPRQPMPAATALPLSFEQLTCLTAEIDANPSRSATALAGYGIDQHAYQTQLTALRVRCEADPELQQRYDRLLQYYRAVVAQR